MFISNPIHIIPTHSELYPKSFSNLRPSPPILFAWGNIQLLNVPGVAVVGARACGSDSIFLTQQFVTELCHYQIPIISGMANGIDTIAHEACLQNGGKTVAIIGSGFHAVEKQKIFTQILEHNGLILSEYFPDMTVRKYNFPRRNQLLVALSKAVIAVEVHMKSGTMITAQEALSQEVPLFTFPGRMMDERYKGNNWLLTKGANCLIDISSVLSYCHIDSTWQPSHSTKYQHYSKTYQQILSILSSSPHTLQTLLYKTNLPLPNLQSNLLLMEMDGLIQKHSNYYYLQKQ